MPFCEANAAKAGTFVLPKSVADSVARTVSLCQMRIETFTWIGHFFTEQIGNNQSGQHVSHDRLQQTILPDSVTLRASIDLALCRIRMRAPCSAMPSAAQRR